MFKKFIRDHKIHKNVVSMPFFDYLFIYKPIYLLGPISLILIGMYLSPFSLNNTPVGILSMNLYTTLFVVGVLMVVSCIFMKNEILSIGEASSIRFKFIEKNIIGDRISVDTAQLIHNYSLGVGVFLILLFHWINIFIIAPIYFLWTSSLINSDNYFKKIGCYAAIAFLLIFSGWLYSGSSLMTVFQCLFFSLPYILFFLATMILIDLSQDKINYLIATGCIIFGFIIAYYNNDSLGSTTLSVSIPFYLFLALRGRERDLIRAIRYPLFLINFFIFTIYPLSMIPLVVIYYISKYYYWHRFDVHFPALAINDDYN